MALLRFSGFCLIALPVTITALSLTIVVWTMTPEPPLRTRLIVTMGGLGSALMSLVVGTRLFLRATFPQT